MLLAAGEFVAVFECAEEIGGGAAAFGFGCAAGRDGAECEEDLGLFGVLDVAGLVAAEVATEAVAMRVARGRSSLAEMAEAVAVLMAVAASAGQVH